MPLIDRVVVLLVWIYLLAFAILLGNGIPAQIASLSIKAESISTGIALVFLAVPIILFLGVAGSGWITEVPTLKSGILVKTFGEVRVAGVIRSLRPAMLLMSTTTLVGLMGIGTTFLTTRSPVAYCFSSYFLAVGLGHIYALYLRKNDSK
jgi:hypothetical protein